MNIPPPQNPTDQSAFEGIQKAYNAYDIGTLYWYKIQPLSADNMAYLNSLLQNQRIIDHIEIKTAVSKKDKAAMEAISKRSLTAVNRRLVIDFFDADALDKAFGDKNEVLVNQMIARTSPPLSAANMKLAIEIRDFLAGNTNNLNQGELDAAGIQAAITSGNLSLLYWYRDTKTPPISEENKKKINDYLKFKEEEEERRRKQAEEDAKKAKADPYGQTISQKDIDLAEFQKLLAANDLKGLKAMRARTEPPLDPEVIAKLDEAIKEIEAKYLEMNVAPDFEIAKPSGVAAPPGKGPKPQEPFRGPIEGFGVGGAFLRGKRKVPPKEEEIIDIKGPTVPPTPGSQGLLTDEGWTMLKNLAFNIVKYTGLYVAPPVLAGIAYQYSANQPDGTLLRAVADIIPKPNFQPEQAEAFMGQVGKVTKLIGEVIPDYLRGTPPGKPGGKMLIDEPALPEGLAVTTDIMQNFQKVASWNVKDRQAVNDIFPKAPSVLVSGRRKSYDISLENFPVVEYRNKDVANYATTSNASVSGDLLASVFKSMSSNVSRNSSRSSQSSRSSFASLNPRQEAEMGEYLAGGYLSSLDRALNEPAKTKRSGSMGSLSGSKKKMKGDFDEAMVQSIAKRTAKPTYAEMVKKSKPTAELSATGKKLKK